MKYFASVLALALGTTAAFADSYTVTVTNNMTEELFAPIVVTDAANDGALFTMGYVTDAAEAQILTGDPKTVVAAIGMDMVTVAHGEDGPPGVLLAPGKSITFTVDTNATALRVLAMVAPTMVPDNYVTALVDLNAGGITVDLPRFDIGHDEGTKTNSPVAASAGTISFVKN
ncbi:hypothetical protein [Yoonia sp.]|uniref:hypothetical protein n=1 Tax=Yoonia sp. TaxID=2212373 RepID=UPI0025D919EB|nr:hypothetical protein [Yoonia sp.]